MSTKHKFVLVTITAFAVAVFGFFLLSSTDMAVLNPKGLIAESQRDLIVAATLLSFIVIIPVFVLTAVIAWKYREGNESAKYSPDWDGDKRLESLWWGVPLLLIVILSGMIWTSSHELDPYKPIVASREPITIEVVALQWKWLFIYPEQNIATVNYVQFPEQTPVNFRLTADAPMNSFWIPSLGGQIYAMAGMSTKLHLYANEAGSYNGSSANLSGEGFSKMTFKAVSSSEADFENWVKSVKRTENHLDFDEYGALASPDTSKPRYYSSKEEDLYDRIVGKYMAPMAHGSAHRQGHKGEE